MSDKKENKDFGTEFQAYLDSLSTAIDRSGQVLDDLVSKIRSIDKNKLVDAFDKASKKAQSYFEKNPSENCFIKDDIDWPEAINLIHSVARILTPAAREKFYDAMSNVRLGDPEANVKEALFFIRGRRCEEKK